MEELAGVIISIFSEACCELTLAFGLDILAGMLGTQTVRRRRQGLNAGRWGTAFKIVLPFAIFITVAVVISIIIRRAK